MSEIFSPTLQWDARDGRILANKTIEYVIDLYEGGRYAASIRRDLPPRAGTRELALRHVGEDFKIMMGEFGDCRVSADKVVAAQGYADFLPAIGRLRIAPDGTIWVQRYGIKGETPPIDIFSPGGEYMGTLPEGAPFPVAFLPGDRIAAIEEDEFEVQRVVVYQVDRSPQDG